MLSKYKQNLRIQADYVVSYDTNVATINHKKRTVTPLGWWSSTTSKHINYAASQLKYKVVAKGGE